MASRPRGSSLSPRCDHSAASRLATRAKCHTTSSANGEAIRPRRGYLPGVAGAEHVGCRAFRRSAKFYAALNIPAAGVPCHILD